MSAFIVTKTHIDALVTAANWRQAGNPNASRFCYYYGGEWIYLEGYGTTATKTPDEIGQMLWDENYRSVNYRYNESEPVERYLFVPLRKMTPASDVAGLVTIFNAIHCYEYQSCETPNWEQTEAFAFCKGLRDHMISLLPQTNASRWEIDDPNVFLNTRSKAVAS